MMSDDHGYHYLCYQWQSLPRRLPLPPRIARGTGYWVPSEQEAVARRLGENRGYNWEAVYAFPDAVATAREVKAIASKPQEEW